MKRNLLFFVLFFFNCSKEIPLENPSPPSDCDRPAVVDHQEDDIFQKKDTGCSVDL